MQKEEYIPNQQEGYTIIARQMGVSYFFNILLFLFSPVLIFLLTRNLSLSEYGVYSLLSSTIAVLSTFLTLSLNMFIITKLTGLSYHKRVEGMASILCFELIFLAGVFLVLFIPPVNNILLSYLKIEGYRLEFGLVLAISFISLICYLLMYYLIANRRLELESFLSFLYNKLWVVLLIIFILLFKGISLLAVFWLWLAGMLISLAAILLFIRKDISFFFREIKAFDLGAIKRALLFSSPLIPASASGWIIAFSDRYMINYLKDSALTGIYSLSYSLAMIVLSFSIIASNVLYPYISGVWGSKKGEHNIFFNAMLKYNLLIILPASTGLFFLRNQIITLISGTNYLPGSGAIAFLIFFPLFAFLMDLYSRNLALRDKTKLIAGIYIFGAVLNIILNYFLIISYGINGAAISTVISYIVMALLFYLATKNQFSWDYRFLKIGRIAVSSLLMGAVVYLINPAMYLTKILTIILGFAVYIALLFLLKVFVKEEYRIMKHFLPRWKEE